MRRITTPALILLASMGLSACVTTGDPYEAACDDAGSHLGFFECVQRDPFHAATSTGGGRAITTGLIAGALVGAMGGDSEEILAGTLIGGLAGYTGFAAFEQFNARSQAEAILEGRSEISTLPSQREIAVEAEFVRASLGKDFDALSRQEKRRLARAWAVLELSEQGTRDFIEAGEKALQDGPRRPISGDAPTLELRAGLTSEVGGKTGEGPMTDRERTLAAELERVREVNEALRMANLELRRAAMNAD